MLADRFLTRSLGDMRIARTLAAALNAVDPYQLVADFLQQNPLPPHERLFLLGLGKAAEGMTRAAAISQHVAGALIITKHASTPVAAPMLGADSPQLTLLEAGHPIPDVRSVAAGEAVLKLASNLRSGDLLLCLISGGGSALVAAPAPGVSLADLQAVTEALLRCGASIEDVNVIRRRLDVLKGGGLAESTPASILSLILSDVVGDPLEAIASGPTAPEPTALAAALNIFKEYKIPSNQAIAAAMNHPPAGPDAAIFARVKNVVIGNNQTALGAALRQARLEGFKAEIVATDVQGEARSVGEKLALQLKEASDSKPRPFCLIAGGETSVTRRTSGKGGRNQELALAAVEVLRGRQDVCLISLATDGEDGSTDAAGAVVTDATWARSKQLGMVAGDYLERHDSYKFFDALGDLLRTGYSGTNVNDLMLLVGV